MQQKQKTNWKSLEGLDSLKKKKSGKSISIQFHNNFSVSNI